MAKSANHLAAQRGLSVGGEADHRLVLRAERLARAAEQGRHRSTERGASNEFYDFRPYEPGDPLAGIDWRLYGRSDRYFVRRFHQDARLGVGVVVDASASMDHAGLGAQAGTPTKLERAVELAAATLALAVRNGDKAGATVVDGVAPPRVVPIGAGRAALMRSAGLLARAKPGALGGRAGADSEEPGPIAQGLASVLAAGKRATGGVIVCFGDGFEALGPLGAAMGGLRRTGRTLVLVRVLAADEHAGALRGEHTLVDPETGKRVRGVDGPRIEAALRAHESALGALAARLGVRVLTAGHADEPAAVLRRVASV